MTAPPHAQPPAVHKLGPHPVVLRELHVLRATSIAPRMRRITLGGDQLAGFSSPAPDDHVVLFFVDDDQPVPTSDDPARRPIWDVRPPTRDYTPRRVDLAAGELDIDFVLHGHGIASDWAAAATGGERIVVGGPRGSLVTEGFAHYLLVGDESASPAIARRLEELPAGTSAHAVLEVAGPEDELDLTSEAAIEVTWVHRGEAEPGTTDLLVNAVRSLTLPDSPTFTYLAGETDAVRRLRAHVLGERGMNKAWLRASGYWKRDATT
jgi:NADPH-dependent ferric siderophore reductase